MGGLTVPVLGPRWGAVAGVVAAAIVSALMLPLRGDNGGTTPALALVLPVVAAGVSGGPVAAFVTAAAAAVAFDVAFLTPYWTLKVDVATEGVALVAYLGVALAVGILTAQEADRRRSAEHRVDEIEQLYRKLDEATEERRRLVEEAARLHVLEQVDSQRSALLRSVSHDLRTPLATIRAVATDLRDGAEHDEATRQELLDAVADEAERLDRLVGNLLSMSRIEAGALQPERQAVDLEELVRERVRRLSPLFRQVRIQLDFPDDLPLVDGDYTLLDQVVSNLLENAARHAPPASAVSVDARTVGAMVEVRVSDEGIGVADFERERIFEPFQHSEGSSSSGLGLAICKAVVEAHGGTITADRTPGGGATFAVRLPARTDRLPRE